jgi:hypothetical protein
MMQGDAGKQPEDKGPRDIDGQGAQWKRPGRSVLDSPVKEVSGDGADGSRNSDS